MNAPHNFRTLQGNPMTTQTNSFAAGGNPDLAATLLRLTNGLLFVLHAGLKIFVFTPAGTVGFFQSIGLPGPLAYLVIAAELLGGIALILGFKTRLVSLGLIPILLGALFTVHLSKGFFFMNEGGGWEYLLFWIVALLVQALLGSGLYAIEKRG